MFRLTGNRASLTSEQRDFLIKVVPLSQLIQQWVHGKCVFTRKSTQVGIHAPLVAADLIIQSDWGTHAIAQPELRGKYSNNLGLLQVNDYWHGKSNTHRGIIYRAYKNWRDFACDYSDDLIFNEANESLFSATGIAAQAEQLSNLRTDPKSYNGKLMALIDFYGLMEITNGT